MTTEELNVLSERERLQNIENAISELGALLNVTYSAVQSVSESQSEVAATVNAIVEQAKPSIEALSKGGIMGLMGSFRG